MNDRNQLTGAGIACFHEGKIVVELLCSDTILVIRTSCRGRLNGEGGEDEEKDEGKHGEENE